MKKSILTTLAVITSVAFMGCNGGGVCLKSYDAPFVEVEYVASTSTYLIKNVLNTDQGKDASDLQFNVVCDDENYEKYLIVDNEQDRIGYLAEAAAEGVECRVTFEGEDLGKGTAIKFHRTIDTTDEEIVNISSDQEDVVNVHFINVTADNKEHHINFKTKATINYNIDDNGTLIEKGKKPGLQKINLRVTGLDEGVVTYVNPACQEGGAGATSCDIILKSNNAAQEGRIIVDGVIPNNVIHIVGHVNFLAIGEEAPPPAPVPTKALVINTQELSLEKQGKYSNYVRIPVDVEEILAMGNTEVLPEDEVVAGDEIIADEEAPSDEESTLNAKAKGVPIMPITKLECIDNSIERGKTAVSCTDLGFVPNKDNTAFFIKPEKLLSLGTHTISIKANDDPDIMELEIDQIMAEEIAAEHFLDMFFVVKTATNRQPKELIIEDEKDVEVLIIIDYMHDEYMIYNEPDEASKESHGREGKNYVQFYGVDKKAGTDIGNKIIVDDSHLADIGFVRSKKCSQFPDYSHGTFFCRIAVRLDGENTGEEIVSGLTIKYGPTGQPKEILKIIKPAATNTAS